MDMYTVFVDSDLRLKALAICSWTASISPDTRHVQQNATTDAIEGFSGLL